LLSVCTRSSFFSSSWCCDDAVQIPGVIHDWTPTPRFRKSNTATGLRLETRTKNGVDKTKHFVYYVGVSSHFDGARSKKTLSGHSFAPFSLIINNFPPNLRDKIEYVLLVLMLGTISFTSLFPICRLFLSLVVFIRDCSFTCL
jgi:hypothetical protein